MKLDYDYHVVLSFAGEDRVYAEELATALKNRRLWVFYDIDEQSTLWGKDLYQHFHNLYSNRAIYCMIIVSEAYYNKRWARHELRSAQERAFKDKKEYILPVRLDNTQIPGIAETIGYIDAHTIPISKIASLVLEKVLDYILSQPNRDGYTLYYNMSIGGKPGSTTILFSQSDYKGPDEPKILDVGVDTGLVKWAYWLGEDIELFLCSTRGESQNFKMASYFMQNYNLEIEFPLCLKDDGNDEDWPVTWKVLIGTKNISEDKLAEIIKKILVQHEETIDSLREQFYKDLKQKSRSKSDWDKQG